MSESVVAVSRIFQHGKTQVPAQIRKYLKLTDGDLVQYRQDYNGKIWISKGRRLSTVKKELGKYV